MKLQSAVICLAIVLTGCATTRPCKVTPPPAPPIQKAAPAPAPVVVAETPKPVETPAPVPVAVPPAPAPIDYEALFNANVSDIFFDVNSSTIRADQKTVLTRNATFLMMAPEIKFRIVSSCDVSGSAPYNQRLGIKRFSTVLDALTSQGAKPESASTIGKTTVYGADKASNRRVHFEFLGAK